MAPAKTSSSSPKKGAKGGKVGKGGKGGEVGKGGKGLKGKGKKKVKNEFVIDCSVPVTENVLDTASFEKFLHDRIKVDGKPGMLGKSVSISREEGKIKVVAKIPFSKRYLKYLTKKYLKKQVLLDYLRVVSKDKQTYIINFRKVATDEGDEGEEEED